MRRLIDRWERQFAEAFGVRPRWNYAFGTTLTGSRGVLARVRGLKWRAVLVYRAATGHELDGWVDVPDPEPPRQTVRCMACYGTGMSFHPARQACDGCHGAGVVRL